MKKSKANHADNRALLDPLALVNERLEEVSVLSQEIKESRDSKKSHTFQKLPKHLKRRQMSTNPARIKKSLRQGLPKVSAVAPTTRKRSYERKPSRFTLFRNRIKENKRYLETHIWHAKRFHMCLLNSFKFPLKRIEKTFHYSINSALKNEKTNDSIIFDTSYFHYFLVDTNNGALTKSDFFEMFINVDGLKLGRINDFYIHDKNQSKEKGDPNNFGLLLNTYRIIGKGAFSRLELFFGKERLKDIISMYKSQNKVDYILQMDYDNYRSKDKKFTIIEQTNIYNNKNTITKLVEDYEHGKDKTKFFIEIIIKVKYIQEYETWDLEVIIPANYGKSFWMAINRYKTAYGGLYELRYLYAVMNRKLAPFDFRNIDYFNNETKEFKEIKNKKLKRRNKLTIEEANYSLKKDNGLFTIKIENGCELKGKPQKGGFLYYKADSKIGSEILTEENGGKLRLKTGQDNLEKTFKLIGHIYYDNYDLVRGRNFGICVVDKKAIEEENISNKNLYYRNTYDGGLFYKCIYKKMQ